MRRPRSSEGLIGPNAATQLIPALARAGLSASVVPIFAAAGAEDWLADPPTGMVGEAKVARLHGAVRRILPSAAAGAVLADAGRLTGDYLLANRIPPAAQKILRLCPPWLAARLLVPAIRAHAWTFAGTGRFAARPGHPTLFDIVENPLRPPEESGFGCVWHRAVFQRLFEVLVAPGARVVETHCAGKGDALCRFELRWRRVPRTVGIDRNATGFPRGLRSSKL